MIDINDITVRIGSKVLLDHASAHIADGWKVGLVGPNGCGKSTLFRVLQGGLETESGNIAFPARYKVVYVEQEISDIDSPILDFILNKDEERRQLLEKLDKASPLELGEIHERLNAVSAASAPARAAAILNGLGFSNEDLTRAVREFSGGWRMRLALAAALFQPSDVLLLDEPTNHLDLEAGMWLQSHLEKYAGTLVLISHDRAILNDLCNYIIHFDSQKLVTYSGNYDTFRKTRALQQELLSKQAAKLEHKRRHLQSFVDRFRYKASKAKQAQSRIKMLEKLESVTLLEDSAAAHFDFPQPEPLSPPLISLEDVSTGYGEKLVLKNLNLRIVDNDRIALLGANGNGKSTFAKLLSGRLAPMSGRLKASAKLEIGYFAQHQSEELPLDMTACEYMATLMPEALEPKVRAHLARFGLEKEKALTQIAKLSGGEKARLLFAAMTKSAPGLLILDEPTNHLDMEAREALITALNEYQGSVILITHDLHLIELIADTLWLVKNNTCREYDGDLEDYRRELLDEKKTARRPEPKAKPADTGLSGKEKMLQKKALQSDIRRLEHRMDRLQEERQRLQEAFMRELTSAEIIAAQKDLAYTENQLADLENEWLEASAALEKLN